VLSARRCASAVTTAALAAALSVMAVPAAQADVKTLDDYAGALVVQPESATTPYATSAFRHWVDADGDGCDTRDQVLVDETQVVPVYAAGTRCTVVSGRWYSYYDGVSTAKPADVAVDHVVALEEAWTSGASRWTAAQREAYANDLDDVGFSLRAVSSAVDAAKGSSDPAEWLPPRPEAWCEYVTGWVTTKWRWNLTADASEMAVVQDVLGTGGCGQEIYGITRAGTPAPTPPPVRDDLAAGTVLAPGAELVSANGRYRAAMQVDGNLVVYAADGRPVWATMTSTRGASLHLQADGNLVLSSASGTPLWFTSTFSTPGNGGGARELVLGDDGNLVLYRTTSGTGPIWYSGWDSGRALDPTRGNVLLPGVQLSTGQAIYSPSRRYGAVMQADGNFVVYAPGNRPLWNARTWGANRYLSMQADGNLVEYDLSSRAQWNARVYAPGARTVLQDDGNLVVYRTNGTAAFYTGWDR